jgi:hypothetical protein
VISLSSLRQSQRVEFGGAKLEEKKKKNWGAKLEKKFKKKKKIKGKIYLFIIFETLGLEGACSLSFRTNIDLSIKVTLSKHCKTLCV